MMLLWNTNTRKIHEDEWLTVQKGCVLIFNEKYINIYSFCIIFICHFSFFTQIKDINKFIVIHNLKSQRCNLKKSFQWKKRCYVYYSQLNILLK